MDITKNQREILDHTAHRAANNHYCGDSEDMQKLCSLGLMRWIGCKGFAQEEYFTITAKGRQILSAPSVE